MLGRPSHEFSPLTAAPLFLAALLALGFLAPQAASADTGSSPLSPQLAELEGAAVLTEAPAAQAEAVGLPSEGPGSLIREGERVVVEARLEAGALARTEALEAAGAKVLTASGRYQRVALSVAPEDLGAVAAVPGVEAVVPSWAPTVYAVEGEPTTSSTVSYGPCEGGSVISKGVEQLRVPAAREAFGARGAGETIGVISDSFDLATKSGLGTPIATTAAGDESTDDLTGLHNGCSGQRTPVHVIAEAPSGLRSSLTDEGRAMLQIVHDIAPHAELAFATAYSSEIEFAENIERLAAPVSSGGAGATVIVDDVSYPTDPDFQEGPVSVAIHKVTEEGVTYLTAAGNENRFEPKTGNEIGSWEAPAFRDAGECPNSIDELMTKRIHETQPGRPFNPECMNFDPEGEPDTTFGITVEAEEALTVNLQWAEPWSGVRTDLDAFIIRTEEGTGKEEVLYSSNLKNAGAGSVGEPIELPVWTNPTEEDQEVEVVINRCVQWCNLEAKKNERPRLKMIFAEDGRGVEKIEYPTSQEVGPGEEGDVVGPSVSGHAGSKWAITLGATSWKQLASTPKEPEPYSSRGPVKHYFGPVNGVTPATPLGTPEVLAKPNLTATDCSVTTFFHQVEESGWHFCGTSAAAPHAAAVAALMRQTDPALGGAGTGASSAIRAAMESSATAYTPANKRNGHEAVGAGLLNAYAAITALGGSPVEDAPSYLLPETPKEEEATPVPVVTITKGPATLGNVSRPTFEFSSTRPATFTCQVDAGTPQACSSPYLLPSALSDGTHSFAVIATDAKGRSSASGVYSFTVDTKAPVTKFTAHPKKVVKTRKKSVVGRFKLSVSESPATIYCKVDREPQKTCAKAFGAHFKPGKHTVRVRAKDAAGNLAAKWTAYSFQVKELPRKR
jgi:subtilisin family serine protease